MFWAVPFQGREDGPAHGMEACPDAAYDSPVPTFQGKGFCSVAFISLPLRMRSTTFSER